MNCGGECGQNKIDDTHQCHSTYFGRRGTKPILKSFTILTFLSLNMHPSHASGRCVGIYASTKLLFSWHATTLVTMISSIILACGMGAIVVG
jgi:hypothetical protein